MVFYKTIFSIYHALSNLFFPYARIAALKYNLLYASTNYPNSM